MDHFDKPEKDLDEKEIELLQSAKEKILNSEYYREITTRFQFIEGRTIKETIAGSSGYILIFDDTFFALSALIDDKLDLKFGDGIIKKEHTEMINSPNYGIATNPVKNQNIPYWDQYCNISEELENCHGLEIEAISIGENSFNLCFENDFELDATVFQDDTGKTALRVFWEQW